MRGSSIHEYISYICVVFVEAYDLKNLYTTWTYNFYYVHSSERFLVLTKFKKIPCSFAIRKLSFNFPDNDKDFPDLINKVEEICEIFMISRNLLQNSSWLKKFVSLTKCIAYVKWSSMLTPISVKFWTFPFVPRPYFLILFQITTIPTKTRNNPFNKKCHQQ